MTQHTAAPSEQSFSVLLIEDNDVSRAVLRFILASQACYRIAGEADSGTSGLELAGRLQPDIVCLDINLPDCNGLDLLRRIKSQWPGMAVLMVSGSDDQHAILRAVQDGADGYITKPFDPRSLLDTMAQALAKA